MKLSDLKEFIAIDIDATEETLSNLEALWAEVSDRNPSVHEQAAFGAYVRDAYTGMENILVRFAKFKGVAIPDSANWHIDLVKMFSDPPAAGLPLLLPDELLAQLTDYRGFRHVFNKRYAAHLDWEKLRPLVAGAPATFRAFHARVNQSIDELAST